MEFYNDMIHVARKEHKCMLCNEKITIGEKYHRQSGKYEGDFFDRCLHNTCNKMITDYCSEMNEQEFDSCCIDEWLQETYCYNCDYNNGEGCEDDRFRCEIILENFKEVEQEPLEIAKECSECTHKAEYSFQDNAYCRPCLIEAIENWEQINKDRIDFLNIDFIIFRLTLEENNDFRSDLAEKINSEFGLDIKRLSEVKE